MSFPPPVYSSLVQEPIRPIYLRSEVERRGWFTSPQFFNVEPKKFATALSLLSIGLAVVGAALVAALVGEHDRDFFLFSILATIPCFLLAVYGIKRGKPGCLWPVISVMFLCSLITTGFALGFIPIFYIAFAMHVDEAASKMDGIVSFARDCGPFILSFAAILVYFIYATRIYCRIRLDLEEEKREESEWEKKLKLFTV